MRSAAFKLKITTSIFIWACTALAQTKPVSDFEELLEETAQHTDQENMDDAAFADDLLFFSEHPIHLNHTKKEELQALHLLSDIQIERLLHHIEKNGALLAIYELQGIEGFDLKTIQKLLPYVDAGSDVFRSSFDKKKLLHNGTHIFVFRIGQVLEKQTGFRSIDSLSLYKRPNARYLGSPQKILASYRYTFGKTLSFGFTAEKDAGELLFKQHLNYSYDWYARSLQGNLRNGFDFYSAHVFVQDVKNIQAFALGDYTITFGQGLVAWSGLSLGKSSEILYTKKSAGGIRPSTSADENRFMRGIATSIQAKQLFFTLFYSRKKVDANVTDTFEDGSAAAISGLQQTGLHSTPAELADKHSVTQTLYGGNIQYRLRKLNLGVTAIQNELNLPLRTSVSSYNQFKSESGNQLNMSLDYQFLLKNFNFFGEAARSSTGGMAFLNGVFISPRLSFTALHRNYQRNYQNRLSAAFGESGSNEKGLYMGISAAISNSVTINACYDRFEFPWLSYQVDAPSYGNDLNVQLNYSPSKKLNAIIKFRYRIKQKNAGEEVSMPYLADMRSESIRLHLAYTLNRSVKLRNRVEFIQYALGAAKQSGYLLYQDILFNDPGKPFSATLRYALFQTDGYDSRLYEYENDIPGSYSIPAFYDRGSRFYILLNYSLGKYVELWLKYAQTIYDNKDVISEGSLTEIRGNKKSELKMQLKFKF